MAIYLQNCTSGGTFAHPLVRSWTTVYTKRRYNLLPKQIKHILCKFVIYAKRLLLLLYNLLASCIFAKSFCHLIHQLENNMSCGMCILKEELLLIKNVVFYKKLITTIITTYTLRFQVILRNKITLRLVHSCLLACCFLV